MNYLVPNNTLVNIFGYNFVNPYPEAIIALKKFAWFENLYSQNSNNVSFVCTKPHLSMYKFTFLIIYVDYKSRKVFSRNN